MSLKKASGIGFLILLSILATYGYTIPSGDTRVKYVVDGDTVILDDNRHVRLLGVDAPEAGHDHKPSEPFAAKAHEHLNALVNKENIRLETDKKPIDHYGRTLAYLYLDDGTFVNQEMVLEGLANCLYFPPNTRYYSRLLFVQQKAMDERRGMWAHWKHHKKTYIGNLKSKRVHLLRCPGASKSHPKNKRSFSNLWKAIYLGYSPCKQCLSTWRSNSLMVN